MNKQKYLSNISFYIIYNEFFCKKDACVHYIHTKIHNIICKTQFNYLISNFTYMYCIYSLFEIFINSWNPNYTKIP